MEELDKDRNRETDRKETDGQRKKGRQTQGDRARDRNGSRKLTGRVSAQFPLTCNKLP